MIEILPIIPLQGRLWLEYLTRRVKKRIKDVPKDKLDIFLKFMDLGEGITVRCGIGSKSVIADAACNPTSLKESFKSSSLITVMGQLVLARR